MKRFSILAAVVALALCANVSLAAGAKKEVKTISGKSACATCEGVTAKGHSIMLIDKEGTRWVLLGDSESYKKAHEVRDEGKKMTATLAGKAETKKDDKGKEYKEVKVSDVKIDEA